MFPRKRWSRLVRAGCQRANLELALSYCTYVQYARRAFRKFVCVNGGVREIAIAVLFRLECRRGAALDCVVLYFRGLAPHGYWLSTRCVWGGETPVAFSGWVELACEPGVCCAIPGFGVERCRRSGIGSWFWVSWCSEFRLTGRLCRAAIGVRRFAAREGWCRLSWVESGRRYHLCWGRWTLPACADLNRERFFEKRPGYPVIDCADGLVSRPFLGLVASSQIWAGRFGLSTLGVTLLRHSESAHYHFP